MSTENSCCQNIGDRTIETVNEKNLPTKSDGILVVNRSSKWGLSGYLQRGDRKLYMGWVSIPHAQIEADLHRVKFVNRLPPKDPVKNMTMSEYADYLETKNQKEVLP
jgi:hypothetical protein